MTGQHHDGLTAALTGPQMAIVLRALADAAAYRRALIAERCEPAPEGACPEHLADLEAAVTYEALAGELAPPAPAELMTRREVAYLFGVTSAAVASWARSGKLTESHGEDGRARYRRPEVEALHRSGFPGRRR